MFSTELFKTFGIACLRADDEHQPLQSNRKILYKKGDAVLPVPPSFYLGELKVLLRTFLSRKVG